MSGKDGKNLSSKQKVRANSGGQSDEGIAGWWGGREDVYHDRVSFRFFSDNSPTTLLG